MHRFYLFLLFIISQGKYVAINTNNKQWSIYGNNMDFQKENELLLGSSGFINHVVIYRLSSVMSIIITFVIN